MTATIEQLQAAIARERAHQDAKWGTVQENPHSLAGWLLIAERELDEAIEAWIRKLGDREAKAELLQFVSVGCAWHEQEQGKPVGDLQEHFYVMGRAERSLEEALGVARHLLSSAWKSMMLDDPSMAVCRIRGAVGTGMAALLQHGIVERDDLENRCIQCGAETLCRNDNRLCGVCAFEAAQGDS